jgi:hypothetical protein
MSSAGTLGCGCKRLTLSMSACTTLQAFVDCTSHLCHHHWRRELPKPPSIWKQERVKPNFVSKFVGSTSEKLAGFATLPLISESLPICPANVHRINLLLCLCMQSQALSVSDCCSATKDVLCTCIQVIGATTCRWAASLRQARPCDQHPAFSDEPRGGFSSLGASNPNLNERKLHSE